MSSEPVLGPRIPDLSPPKHDAGMSEILSNLRRKHGSESVILMSEEIAARTHEVLPSGSLELDKALGGGWPFGRIVEMYGIPGGGKSTMALQAVASVQRLKGRAAYVDAEHCFDPVYAARIGVDVPNLLIAQPVSGEDTMAMTESLAQEGVNLIVIDSVAALVPKAELEGDMGDSRMGAHANLMSKTIKRLNTTLPKKCILFCLNQVRTNIGAYGNPEVSTGGAALKFYASIRVDIRAADKLKKGEEIIGHNVKIKVAKNKLASPFRTVEVGLIYGRGLWRSAEVLDLAVRYGHVEKSGAWFSHDNERLGQGRENTAARLETMPELLDKLEAAVRVSMYAPTQVA